MKRLRTTRYPLILALGLVLTACGGGGDSGDTTTQTSGSTGGTSTTVGTNHAPLLTGAPVITVQAGNTYSFAPSAADVDGDKLLFSITNLPAWASFNTSTGQLAGSPTDSDVGTTTGIVISVSDGTTTAKLASFDVTVLGSGTVSWVAPSTRLDGNPLQLAELSGYRIYYGIAADQLDQVIDISDPTATEYVVKGLSPNTTYYFTVTAVDTYGVESPQPPVVSKIVG